MRPRSFNKDPLSKYADDEGCNSIALSKDARASSYRSSLLRQHPLHMYTCELSGLY